ncbi:hypothetical protein PVAND_002865 [Polypedilum vanderplanki]|uniref:Uncharacterized protein n=1 Tax=Polypedilum vanderplanki TaxID=319348 RepID=A0A9J6BSB1_POLVA|nr:hypothetical protein PVAND_002865 [Polypedilum vanderplanki]
MSNTKVLNFSSSSSSKATTAFKLSATESKLLKMSSSAAKQAPSTTTPRLTRKPCANTSNLSPLRSPQLIRTKNWINSNKISSGSSSTCSDESIIPKYEQQQQQQSSSYINTSQKRAYNFNKVTTTKKLLNSARNTAIVYEKDLKVSATATASSASSNKVNNEKFSSRNCEINKSFKNTTSSRIVPNKIFKPTVPSNTSISSSSSSTTSSIKSSFSSKYPNGLPFEDEFYHYRQNTKNTINKNSENMSSASMRKINRHNIRISRSVGSVASDKSSSSLSNNSQNDYFHETHDIDHHLHNDHMRASPAYMMTYDDSDVMYVDFSLKSVDKLKQITNQQRNCLKKPTLSAVKTTYYINDKNDNCFCEFESIKSTTGALNKLIEGKQDVRVDKRQKDSVVYVTWSCYDIPHRNERYQRRSIESDKKLLRRHRKHRNDTRDNNDVISGSGSMKNSQKDGVGHKKVSIILTFYVKRSKVIFDDL